MDLKVVHDVCREAGRLEQVQRPLHAIRVVWMPLREQLTAEVRHRQVGMAATVMDKLHQCQHTGPCTFAADQPVLTDTLKLLAQTLQAVSRVKHRVVTSQQAFPAFGEQNYDQPHDHSHGRPVDVLCLDGFRVVLQCWCVGLNQQFGGPANPLTEFLRKIRLPLAAVVDCGEQWCRLVLLRGNPQSRLEETAQAIELGRCLTFAQPQIDVPFAKRFVVETGEQQPPLVAVGDEGKLFRSLSQPLQRVADDSMSSPDPETFLVIDKDRQRGTVQCLPQMTRSNGLAGDRLAGPLPVDVSASRPCADGRRETAQRFENVRDELASMAARIVEEAGHLSAELVLLKELQWLRVIGNQGRQSLRIKQQSTVTQTVPPCETIRVHDRLPSLRGNRTSTATGKTCASPCRAYLFGRRRVRIRSRSRASCSRTSS